MYDSMVCDVLKEWKEGTKVSHLMLYSPDSVYSLFIQTVLVYLSASAVRELLTTRKKLKALPIYHIEEVHIEETHDIF